MYFAETLDLTNSESLAVILIAAGFILALPVGIGLFYTLQQKTLARYSRYFMTSLVTFSGGVVVFGLLSGILTRVTDTNIIDEQGALLGLFLLVFAVSAAGIFGSAVAIITHQLRK